MTREYRKRNTDTDSNTSAGSALARGFDSTELNPIPKLE